MIVYEKQHGKITLNDQDFLAEGGEGRLYAQGNTVYKIYHDPAHSLPPAKFDELQLLNHPGIIKPVSLLTDAKHRVIGYTMPRAPQAVPLAQLFTTSFRDQHRITPDMTLELVKNMQAIIKTIHQKGFLMVDGNEFNYIVDESNWVTPYFIDVDSWQTPSFKASAIMPSIRDYSANDFSELTDWYSFAIIACQLFIGIHPFKGRHPDYGKGDMEARMRANVSVFNKSVSFPSSVRDFSSIPKPYYEWFMDVFEKGLRRQPPDGAMQAQVIVKRVVLQDGRSVKIRTIQTYSHNLEAYKVFNGTPMVLLGGQIAVGKEYYSVPSSTQAVVLLLNHEPLFFGVANNQLWARVGDGRQHVNVSLNASRVFAVGNAAYIINGNQLMELNVKSINGRVLIAPGKVVRIMPNAHAVYTGLVVQYVMGKPYLIIPYQPGSFAQVRVPELDGYRIVEARYLNRVVLIKAATREGRYDLIRLRFTAEHKRYDIDIRQDYDETINFAVIDRGVTVQMVGDGKMEMYLNTPDNQDIRFIEDNQLRMDMQLFDHGGKLAAYHDNQVVELSLAQP